MLADHGHATERIIIQTQGDADRISPLAQIGGQGVFTSALQVALVRREIDVAVHSAKDLPSTKAEGLTLVAFLSRQDPRDVLVSKTGAGLAELPHGATVGTSSRRRIAQARSVRPDLAIVDLRGNIDTRIRRATDGDLDAVILAAAGLHRMGWQDRISEYLPLDTFVPAPAQAALALEVRAGDEETTSVVAALDDGDVSRCVRAERAFLRALGAGCTTPIGAHANLVDGTVRLRAMIADEDLTAARWATVNLDQEDEEDHAAEVAADLAEPDQTVEWAAYAAEVRAGRAVPNILVTRPDAQAIDFAEALTVAGYEPVLTPMLLVGPGDPAATGHALAQLEAGAFDWVVFSSGNGPLGIVATLPESRFAEDPGDLLGDVRVAAVGPGTAARLLDLGVDVDLVAERSDATGLVEVLSRQGLAGQRVWLPQGDLARPDLAEGLRSLGAEVTTTVVYRVAPPDRLGIPERRMITEGGIHALTFASPSAADHLVTLLGRDRAALDDIPAICIGETTAARVRELGLAVGAVADEPSDAGMVAALNHLFPAMATFTPQWPNDPDVEFDADPGPDGTDRPDHPGDLR
jgi:hydroxymethylbilane synthase